MLCVKIDFKKSICPAVFSGKEGGLISRIEAGHRAKECNEIQVIDTYSACAPYALSHAQILLSFKITLKQGSLP